MSISAAAANLMIDPPVGFGDGPYRFLGAPIRVAGRNLGSLVSISSGRVAA